MSEQDKKAIMTVDMDLDVPPDYEGNPTLDKNDELSLIEITDEGTYLFSVVKLQGTGASCIELDEGEFEFVDIQATKHQRPLPENPLNYAMKELAKRETK